MCLQIQGLAPPVESRDGRLGARREANDGCLYISPNSRFKCNIDSVLHYALFYIAVAMFSSDG